jgi:hydroxymethylbilane synthase
VHGIRGNVDSRIARVATGDYEAVVLAAAGLERLGRLDEAAQVFSTHEMLPAVGQAVLAVQCRAADQPTVEVVRRLDHAPTRTAITAERAFLARLGAGCRLPVGAYAEIDDGRVHLRTLLADESNRIHHAEASADAEDAERLGCRLAEQLLSEAGA